MVEKRQFFVKGRMKEKKLGREMGKLILMRHGKSLWNERGIFTGWVDIPLSEKGVEEAMNAGKELTDVPIDGIFVSALMRAQMTAFLAMLHHHSKKVPVFVHAEGTKEDKWSKIFDEDSKKETIPTISAWQLNERMYGELQGKNKQKTREEFGDNQVQIWRRSYATAPPKGESLKDTAERTLPYFKEKIIPLLDLGKNILISAHGNSLRSITMFIEDLSEEEIVKVEIPTGKPIIYNYENKKFGKQ